MNLQLLNQYNVKFSKVNTDKGERYRATGGGMASYLSNIGRDTDEIQEALEKATFFINGNSGDAMLILEKEAHHFNSVWADFDYQNAYISEEIADPGYIQTLPLQAFKDILLMWEAFIKADK